MHLFPEATRFGTRIFHGTNSRITLSSWILCRMTVKIAYSSSFGEVHMSTEVKQKVRKLLERYDAIAVRENSGKNLVEDMGLSAKVVLDPTMLCDRTVWDELAASRLLKQDYVLLFQINPNKELLHFAEEFARSQK